MRETVSLMLSIAVALVKKPRLIPTAIRQARVLAPTRWWARDSRLPIPPADYMAFRNTTLSGDGAPTAHDAIVYLEWCRSMRSLPQRG